MNSIQFMSGNAMLKQRQLHDYFTIRSGMIILDTVLPEMPNYCKLEKYDQNKYG